jgi:cellulose synthase/poly-beta-1,6-N-acetylglucosamine synthase-like glycosyltransferase
LVYVDGGSPPLVRQYLEQRAARHGFRLLSTERFLSPNEARNLAAAQIQTPYVAFVDNDVVVSPGWLEALVDCAEEKGAWAVGPVVCEGEPVGTRISTAAGSADIVAGPNGCALHEQARYAGQPLAALASTLRREAVGRVSFQAVLLRTEALKALGPLDEQLLSEAQDLDFCLLTRNAGQAVYFEPRSIVTHLPPPPFEEYDLDFFQLRWSDAWNRATLEHFREKWNLSHNDPGLIALASRLDAHRRLTLEPYRRLLRLLGNRPAQWFERMLIAPLEQAANRRRVPQAQGSPRKAA